MTARKERKDWMKKGPAPKYTGGSKPKTFRLPVKHFSKAVKDIEKYLKQYEN